MPYSLEDAQKFLDLLAPFARNLDFEILGIEPGFIDAKMPKNDLLRRDIGVLCGQSILAAADSLGPICIASKRGAYTDMTTADMSCYFLHALPVTDTMIRLRLLKDGRKLSVVQAEFSEHGYDRISAVATVTYAHLNRT